MRKPFLFIYLFFLITKPNLRIFPNFGSKSNWMLRKNINWMKYRSINGTSILYDYLQYLQLQRVDLSTESIISASTHVTWPISSTPIKISLTLFPILSQFPQLLILYVLYFLGFLQLWVVPKWLTKFHSVLWSTFWPTWGPRRFKKLDPCMVFQRRWPSSMGNWAPSRLCFWMLRRSSNRRAIVQSKIGSGGSEVLFMTQMTWWMTMQPIIFSEEDWEGRSVTSSHLKIKLLFV